MQPGLEVTLQAVGICVLACREDVEVVMMPETHQHGCGAQTMPVNSSDAALMGMLLVLAVCIAAEFSVLASCLLTCLCLLSLSY